MHHPDEATAPLPGIGLDVPVAEEAPGARVIPRASAAPVRENAVLTERVHIVLEPWFRLKASTAASRVTAWVTHLGEAMRMTRARRNGITLVVVVGVAVLASGAGHFMHSHIDTTSVAAGTLPTASEPVVPSAMVPVAVPSRAESALVGPLAPPPASPAGPIAAVAPGVSPDDIHARASSHGETAKKPLMRSAVIAPKRAPPPAVSRVDPTLKAYEGDAMRALDGFGARTSTKH